MIGSYPVVVLVVCFVLLAAMLPGVFISFYQVRFYTGASFGASLCYALAIATGMRFCGGAGRLLGVACGEVESSHASSLAGPYPLPAENFSARDRRRRRNRGLSAISLCKIWMSYGGGGVYNLSGYSSMFG